jgi:hypothetical protein
VKVVGLGEGRRETRALEMKPREGVKMRREYWEGGFAVLLACFKGLQPWESGRFWVVNAG